MYVTMVLQYLLTISRDFDDTESRGFGTNPKPSSSIKVSLKDMIWSFKNWNLRMIHPFLALFIIIIKGSLIGTITLKFRRAFRKKRLVYNLIHWSQRFRMYASVSLMRDIVTWRSFNITEHLCIEINRNHYLMHNQIYMSKFCSLIIILLF